MKDERERKLRLIRKKPGMEPGSPDPESGPATERQEGRRTVYEPGRGIVYVSEDVPTEDPETEPETDPETDPGTEPETDPETDPGTEPERKTDPKPSFFARLSGWKKAGGEEDEDEEDWEDEEDEEDGEDAEEPETIRGGRAGRRPAAGHAPEEAPGTSEEEEWPPLPDKQPFDFSGAWKYRLKRLLRWVWRYRRIVVPVLVFVLVLIGFLGYNRVITFRSYILAATYENTVSSGTSYMVAGKDIYKYNADGISFVSRNNDLRWSITYSMQAPIADLCGDVMAVAEQQGMQVHIVNKDGEIGAFETDSPILKVRVSEQGLVAVILAEDEITWVNLYEPDGTLVASDKATLLDFGYPVDCAISPDGTRILVSYIKIQGGALTDDLVFYHFGQAGQKKENHIVGKWTYDGEVVPEVYYVDDSQAVAVSDSGFTVYTGTETPRRGTSVSFDEEIVSCFHERSSIGFLFRDTEGEAQYRMELYRLNGNRQFKTRLDAQFDTIRMNHGQILLFDDRNMTVVTSSGHLRFSADYEKNIVDFFYLEEYRKYLVATPDSFDRIRIGT